jgi:acyl-CoA thioester hydrolase
MAGFRFRFPIEVRFRDLDLLGHVNNAVFLTYLESARIAYWMHVSGRPLDDLGMILARVEVDYRAPVPYGARLDVGVRCASMKRSSFVLELEAVEEGSGRVVAEARKVLVHYDYAAGRPVPLTDDLRDRIRRQDPDVRLEA